MGSDLYNSEKKFCLSIRVCKFVRKWLFALIMPIQRQYALTCRQMLLTVFRCQRLYRFMRDSLLRAAPVFTTDFDQDI